MSKNVYIINPLEHGNGGVHGYDLLDTLPLEQALLKTPYNYGIFEKEWGFWPMICKTKNYNKPIYYWEEDTETWEKNNG